MFWNDELADYAEAYTNHKDFIKRYSIQHELWSRRRNAGSAQYERPNGPSLRRTKPVEFVRPTTDVDYGPTRPLSDGWARDLSSLWKYAKWRTGEPTHDAVDAEPGKPIRRNTPWYIGRYRVDRPQVIMGPKWEDAWTDALYERKTKYEDLCAALINLEIRREKRPHAQRIISTMQSVEIPPPLELYRGDQVEKV